MYGLYIDAPKGLQKAYLQICCSEVALKSVMFCDVKTLQMTPNDIAISCAMQLEKYFKGELLEFDLPLDPDGSDFCKKVWKSLCGIKFAQTKSYKQIALELGGSNYSRAIGGANAKNPISIIIPCHRVIANDGSLSGYAGGVEVKKWLLEHERDIFETKNRS